MTILKSEVNPHGFTKMLERLGRDCTPLQYVREYVQNSIEAIQRTEDKTGEILVDVNWGLLENNPGHPFKLSFTDNGIGMTGEELIKYIKDLSSSGESNIFENYGMGAKIASITRNRAGILYESWKSGEGYCILMKYDESEDAYGLEQFHVGGEYTFYAPVNEEAKPDMIGEHGTRVTLFGGALEDDTMDVPGSIKGSREAWLYQYLGARYFSIPEGITIKVRIGYDRPRDDKKHNHLLNIKGQKAVLDNHKLFGGITKLSDADVNWWILNPERSGHGREDVKGHTAVLNQGEVFDKTDGRSNRAVLFGVTFGQKDVVLYIEPDKKKYVQNTTRTALIGKDGTELPWEKWADEFRAAMPKELKEYIEAIMSQAGQDSHEKSIRDRLKNLRDFYKVSRYRPVDMGKFSVDMDSIMESNTGSVSNGTGGGHGKPGLHHGGAKDMLASLLKDGGANAEAVKPDPFPRVDWVSLAEGTRDDNEMEDRAARFLVKDNLIKANKDFQGFKDIIAFYMKQYQHIPGSDTVVPDVVRELFEQQLIENVAGALSFRGRKHWTPSDFDDAVSEEALTTAVMGRYYLMQTAKRMLNQRLGKPDLIEGDGFVAA